MTPGLDVFVQEVMAAITTDPCDRSKVSPLNSSFDLAATYSCLIPNPLKPTSLVKHFDQSDLSYLMVTKSCGLFGPATLGSTEDKSS